MDVNNKKTKILLIGCTGFLGGRLLEKLVSNSKNEISVISNSFSGNGLARAARFSVNIIPGNILDIESMKDSFKGIDVVINGSYLKGGGKNTKLSVKGTENLIKLAKENNIKQFIQISSAAVFEPDNSPLKNEESSFISKPDDYVKTKLLTEKKISNSFKINKKESTRFTIIRPTRIYGPYSDFWTKRILDAIKENKITLIEDFKSNPSNFVYVDDVCRAIEISILNDQAYNQDFNINGEKELTWEKLIGGFNKILGTSNNEAVSFLELKRINSLKTRKMLPNALSSLKKVLLSNESLDIFRNDLLLSTLYRNFYGRFRRSDKSISYSEPLKSSNKDYSFLDRYCIKDMKAKTYICSEKIKNTLDFKSEFNFEKSVDEIASWYKFFSREDFVIKDFLEDQSEQ